MSNYPDDIRRYDNDPRSPFYDEPEQEVSEDQINEYFEQEDIVERLIECKAFADVLRDLVTCCPHNKEVIAYYAKKLIMTAEQYAKECLEDE